MTIMIGYSMILSSSLIGTNTYGYSLNVTDAKATAPNMRKNLLPINLGINGYSILPI